ncbi:hypothetical protein SteCoe_35317 [Stentor coeruleus]|uniref:Uncharacterized protein n=1 Tax=Stentor coeruleus TaxID=5963 RepID=A0A1R2ASJ6_9CILI|nr:hypothetical protein SteCoe_35317 [Stentor coeruleus]
MNETLIQVFNKKYAENVLEKVEQPGNNHWESFRIRAIVFSTNDLETKWTITIRELIFNKEKLQIACKNFEKKEKRSKRIDRIFIFFCRFNFRILK